MGRNSATPLSLLVVGAGGSGFLCEWRPVSSLEKVFYSRRLEAPPIPHVTAARGETSAFQIAFRVVPVKDAPQSVHARLEPMRPSFGHHVSVRAVAHVACTRPADESDTFILADGPGIFPAPLLPKNEIWLRPGYWQSFWIDFRPDETASAGLLRIAFRLAIKCGDVCDEKEIAVNAIVRDFVLPRQRLKCAMWFHPDCLQRRYGVEAWSERHWEIIADYMRDRAAHGINVILTPLWSVPLDTAVGHERPTCQLLKIRHLNGKYTFDFSRLDRWIELARSCGTDCFEMSHAYTQWGARHAPKIVVEDDNGEQHVHFGWHTDAHGHEYHDFLRQLMAELLPFLRSRNVTPANCYFHVSDEPDESNIDSYAKASGFLRGLIEDYPALDALSHIAFLRRGLTDHPVPKTNALADFCGEKVSERWVYYCGNWADGVPNRLFGMPSWRNRALGVLLYWLGLDGFLHWGYNFWFSRESLDLDLDPWHDPCAGGDFFGGDSFAVYPGRDGHPVSTIHYEVFAQALQDFRALDLLESLIGRNRTMDIVSATLPPDFGELTMTHYPRNRDWVPSVREAVDSAIVAASERDCAEHAIIGPVSAS